MALFNKEEKTEKEATTTTSQASKTAIGSAYMILERPLVSEKGFKLNTLGQYIFRVSSKANKVSVRNAVEKIYDVHVVRVNMLNVRGKTRNFGRIAGKTSNWKKAIVTLKKGEVIQGAQV